MHFSFLFSPFIAMSEVGVDHINDGARCCGPPAKRTHKYQTPFRKYQKTSQKFIPQNVCSVNRPKETKNNVQIVTEHLYSKSSSKLHEQCSQSDKIRPWSDTMVFKCRWFNGLYLQLYVVFNDLKPVFVMHKYLFGKNLTLHAKFIQIIITHIVLCVVTQRVPGGSTGTIFWSSPWERLRSSGFCRMQR